MAEEINWIKYLYLWCKMKGYSMDNTFPVYRDTLNKILRQFPKLETTTLLEIQEYAASIPNDNTRKNTCVLIRWAFNTVLHKPIDWRDLPYPKRKRKIQPIYSHEEAMKIFNSVKHEKQKAILALIIDQGLRISEPCPILIADCNSKERSIILRSAKGDEDRVIYPSEFVWKLIKSYWKKYEKKITDKYLFDGQVKGNPYTEESIRGFVRQHCWLSGVPYKQVHAFRRYSITFSHEHGASLPALAERSGHKTTRTIEKHYLNHSPAYLKTAASPFQHGRYLDLRND